MKCNLWSDLPRAGCSEHSVHIHEDRKAVKLVLWHLVGPDHSGCLLSRGSVTFVKILTSYLCLPYLRGSFLVRAQGFGFPRPLFLFSSCMTLNESPDLSLSGWAQPPLMAWGATWNAEPQLPQCPWKVPRCIECSQGGGKISCFLSLQQVGGPLSWWEDL